MKFMFNFRYFDKIQAVMKIINYPREWEFYFHCYRSDKVGYSLNTSTRSARSAPAKHLETWRNSETRPIMTEVR